GAGPLDAGGHHVRLGVVARKDAAEGYPPLTLLRTQQEVLMHRRKFLAAGASLRGALVARPFIARAAAPELIVPQPAPRPGYLPIYVGIAKSYFAEADITVKILTIETGSGHTNAVLSGQAFAFIGGPEHNAFAKAKGAELRAVVHCVDRGNIYYCAANGHE